MGADLYLESLFTPNYEEWSKRFDDAVTARDKLAEGSPEYEQAHERACEYFEKMYATGFFREPYNSSSLLWVFELSWWTDVGGLRPDGYLTTAGAESLLALLAEREDTFRDNLSGFKPGDAAYFEDEYARLRDFLGQAIALKEPIRCSL